MMKQRLDEIKQLLAALPRVSLAFLPTPLHKLDNLSQDLGINLYVKRDDFKKRYLIICGICMLTVSSFAINFNRYL